MDAEGEAVPVKEPAACGIGRGAECCAYLAMGGDGFECARATSLKAVIDERVAQGSFTAQRQPTEELWDCQRREWV